MGAVGSLHCIGMCGPLALALPISHRSQGGRLAGGTLYNLGRVLTYTMMGAILGGIGQTLFSSHWQSLLSVTFGILIFIYLLIPSKLKSSTLVVSLANKPFMQLRDVLGKLFRSPKYTSLFSIGMLNGLLPCGMIYLAVSSSLLTGTAAKGALFMLAFGVGTFPAMLGAVFFGSYINQQFRQLIRRAVPIFLFVMAALLVLRGLNLGIPFISPQLPAGSQAAVSCH